MSRLAKKALPALLVLAAGCCVVERAADVAVEGAGKLVSKGVDAAASSDGDGDAPKKK
jgi:hypothetical protein